MYMRMHVDCVAQVYAFTSTAKKHQVYTQICLLLYAIPNSLNLCKKNKCYCKAVAIVALTEDGNTLSDVIGAAAAALAAELKTAELTGRKLLLRKG